MATNNSVDPATFTADQNAWCIAANVTTNTPDGVPVMFTRNIDVTNTAHFTGPIRDTLIDVPPLKLDGVVVVLNGGAAWALHGAYLDQDWEDVIEPGSPGNYPVLRP